MSSLSIFIFLTLDIKTNFSFLNSDLPVAMIRLVKNKLYMAIIFAICVKIYMGGFMTFLPKYIALQFGITASVASILSGNPLK